MTLFSKVGARPVELPFMDHDEEGNAWTNLADNEEGRLACGWTEALLPEFDPQLQRVDWIDGAWAIQGLPAKDLADQIEQLRAQRLAALTAIRWDRQQSVSWSERSMPADDVTMGRVSAKMAILLQRGSLPAATFTWKFGPTAFETVSFAELLAYGDAIDLHVQACFDREATLCAQLLAAPDSVSLEAIDIESGWPG